MEATRFLSDELDRQRMNYLEMANNLTDLEYKERMKAAYSLSEYEPSERLVSLRKAVRTIEGKMDVIKELYHKALNNA